MSNLKYFKGGEKNEIPPGQATTKADRIINIIMWVTILSTAVGCLFLFYNINSVTSYIVAMPVTPIIEQKTPSIDTTITATEVTEVTENNKAVNAEIAVIQEQYNKLAAESEKINAMADAINKNFNNQGDNDWERQTKISEEFEEIKGKISILNTEADKRRTGVWQGVDMHRKNVATYNQVLLIDQNNKHALYWKAYSLFHAGLHGTALLTYNKFVKIYPNDQDGIDARNEIKEFLRQ